MLEKVYTWRPHGATCDRTQSCSRLGGHGLQSGGACRTYQHMLEGICTWRPRGATCARTQSCRQAGRLRFAIQWGLSVKPTKHGEHRYLQKKELQNVIGAGRSLVASLNGPNSPPNCARARKIRQYRSTHFFRNCPLSGLWSTTS